jgi:hypothetical protein
MVDDKPITLKKDQLLELSTLKLIQPLTIVTGEQQSELLALTRILQLQSKVEVKFYLLMEEFQP